MCISCEGNVFVIAIGKNMYYIVVDIKFHHVLFGLPRSDEIVMSGPKLTTRYFVLRP